MRQKNKEGISRKLLGARRKSKALGMATLLTFIFSTSTLSAQENVNTTGANASGNGGSISYSVGQVAYQTHTGANGSLAEGIQQPYEISVVTGIEEVIGIILSVSAYPNPTIDYLTLEVKDFKLTNLHFQLYDMNGKLLQNQKITDSKTSIVMSNLVPAMYYVKVIQGNKEVKTFKIIKN